MKTKKTEQRIVNLETASAFDGEIEGFSGDNFSDEPMEFESSQPITSSIGKTPGAKINLTTEQITKPGQEDANNIHNLVQNALHQINKYKEENNVNEHENLLERLEQLKNLRDSS